MSALLTALGFPFLSERLAAFWSHKQSPDGNDDDNMGVSNKSPKSGWEIVPLKV